METKTIYWKDAVEHLKKGYKLDDYTIDYRNEMVLWLDVSLLNENGFSVPEDLIDIDEDSIDYSDCPEVSLEAIEAGHFRVVSHEEFEKRFGIVFGKKNEPKPELGIP